MGTRRDLDALDLAPGVVLVLGVAVGQASGAERLANAADAVVFGILLAEVVRARVFGRKNRKLGVRGFTQKEGTFAKRYAVGRELGKGFFGVVVVAVDRNEGSKEEGRCFAAKCVDRLKLTEEDEAQIHSEAAILKEIENECPLIIKLCDFYKEPQSFYLVLELMRGGELFDRVAKMEKYYEKDARVVIRSVAQALVFLHELDIVHRDLKPENILMETESPNSRIKIADFGFARKVGKRKCTTACGTPNYVAPEIVNGTVYDASVDVWALGVITFLLLAGYPPFYHKEKTKMFKLIRKADFTFASPYWDLISFTAQDFISKCLTVDPQNRMTAEEALDHPWLSSKRDREKTLRSRPSAMFDEPGSGEYDLAPTTLVTLKLFNARKRLRSAILAAIATNRLNQVVEMLRSDQKESERVKSQRLRKRIGGEKPTSKEALPRSPIQIYHAKSGF